ncbi:hypothetical protein E3P99_03133 [Wallemia hederae]|uniref:Uncharacterized protein n=1 Tax=Wallemia hederae TaxID=1540922 RepID=A0A4T0FJD4_9BASI|nr:hypothetical protein E3P99_03133 [Wallemia hederae]
MTMATKSSFGKILQRSKYASYDPSIAQTFTASHAHRIRGDYGFKRSILGGQSIRVRSQENELGEVDYVNTTGDAKVIQRINELRVAVEGLQNPAVPYSSYSSPSTDKETVEAESITSRPDIESMSESEFARYVEHVKGLRGDFKQYLAQQAKEQLDKKAAARGQKEQAELPDVDLYYAAQRDPYVHQQFLKLDHTQSVKGAKKSSSLLTSNPHANGGLRYSHPSPIETNRLSPAVHGRILPNTSPNRRFKREKKPIALGGIVASTDMSNLSGLAATDFANEHGATSRDTESGKARFRVVNKAVVNRVPRVVDNESGMNTLEGAVIDVDVVEAGSVEKLTHTTPHALGSPEYVSTFEKDIPSGRSRPVGIYNTVNSPLFNRKKRADDGDNEVKISELLRNATLGGDNKGGESA